MKIFKKILNGLSELWRALDYVPDCPVCHGTREPSNGNSGVPVYWKGQIVNVCYNCEGKGKV